MCIVNILIMFEKVPNVPAEKVVGVKPKILQDSGRARTASRRGSVSSPRGTEKGNLE